MLVETRGWLVMETLLLWGVGCHAPLKNGEKFSVGLCCPFCPQMFVAHNAPTTNKLANAQLAFYPEFG